MLYKVIDKVYNLNNPTNYNTLVDKVNKIAIVLIMCAKLIYKGKTIKVSGKKDSLFFINIPT